MRLLEWKLEWETGIRRIDLQHRAMFEQAERLMDAIHKNDVASQIPGLLNFMSGYVGFHFKDEEDAMGITGYPELAKHSSIHMELREKVQKYVLQAKEDPSSITDEVIGFVVDWLIDHIDVEDRKMAQYLLAWSKDHPEVELASVSLPQS